MKRYAEFSKNIAALLMFLALLALLLPCCKIQTADTSIQAMSGYKIIKITASCGYHYLKDGTIADDYILTDTVTWGDVNDIFDYASIHGQLTELCLFIGLCMLPVILCLLAMLMTFIAEGKKTMFLPTLCLALVVFENIIIISGLTSIVNTVSEYMTQKGANITKVPDITLLIGIYIFALLCGIALIIILFLWITGGFNKPRRHRRNTSSSDNNDDDDNDSSNNKKRRKKHRKKRGSRRNKKNKKDKSSNKNDNKDNTTKDTENAGEIPATGMITGQSGIYENTNINLTDTPGSSYTLGTTKEALDSISGGNINDISKIAGNNCVINYDSLTGQYTITSHSIADIVLQNTTNGNITLTNGSTGTATAGTTLYAGNTANSIKLN